MTQVLIIVPSVSALLRGSVTNLRCSCVSSLSVCFRSKRKMLGRRDSEDDRHHSSSSSSSPPITPTAPPSGLKPKVKSRRSESFKALLLRKGSRSDSSSRISAVERLSIVGALPNLQCVTSLPTPPEPILDTGEVDGHLSLDVPVSPTPLCSQDFALMFGWRRRDPTHNPFFFLSAPSMRPHALTPPCSASRRFAARCRLYAAPMTAIFEVGSEEEEEEEKEEEDDDVFIESPGSEGELRQRSI